MNESAMKEILKRLDALEKKIDLLLKDSGKESGVDRTAQIVVPKEKSG